MRRDPWIPECTGERNYDQGRFWNARESKKIMEVRSGDMVKKTYPDEKGVSSSDSRETNEERQMQETGNSGNQVSCEFHPNGLSLSPQPRAAFEWNSLANMNKDPICLTLT